MKIVKECIKQNELALTDILREYDIDSTRSVAKKLLENRVFDSTLKAKIRFPESFDVSPTRNAEREASEAEAARDEAGTVREILDRDASKDSATILTPNSKVNGHSVMINPFTQYIQSRI
ncbi:MAG: hypothetical protein LBE64_23130 [Acinetobacter pittii]|nr:hypothetical protein [Acinetobacter pittii]